MNWKLNFKTMKRLSYILFVLCSCIATYAQDIDEPQPQEQDATAKEKIKAARIGLITQRLNLTPEQAQKFWPLYNEFVQKRGDLMKPYKEAERNINPNKPDPVQQQALLDLGLKIKQNELGLEREYADKMRGVITAQQ